MPSSSFAASFHQSRERVARRIKQLDQALNLCNQKLDHLLDDKKLATNLLTQLNLPLELSTPELQVRIMNSESYQEAKQLRERGTDQSEQLSDVLSQLNGLAWTAGDDPEKHEEIEKMNKQHAEKEETVAKIREALAKVLLESADSYYHSGPLTLAAKKLKIFNEAFAAVATAEKDKDGVTRIQLKSQVNNLSLDSLLAVLNRLLSDEDGKVRAIVHEKLNMALILPQSKGEAPVRSNLGLYIVSHTIESRALLRRKDVFTVSLAPAGVTLSEEVAGFGHTRREYEEKQMEKLSQLEAEVGAANEQLNQFQQQLDSCNQAFAQQMKDIEEEFAQIKGLVRELTGLLEQLKDGKTQIEALECRVQEVCPEIEKAKEFQLKNAQRFLPKALHLSADLVDSSRVAREILVEAREECAKMEAKYGNLMQSEVVEIEQCATALLALDFEQEHSRLQMQQHKCRNKLREVEDKQQKENAMGVEDKLAGTDLLAQKYLVACEDFIRELEQDIINTLRPVSESPNNKHHQVSPCECVMAFYAKKRDNAPENDEQKVQKELVEAFIDELRDSKKISALKNTLAQYQVAHELKQCFHASKYSRVLPRQQIAEFYKRLCDPEVKSKLKKDPGNSKVAAFVKACGVVVATLLGFGVGGYHAYQRLFGKRKTLGHRFVEEVSPSMKKSKRAD